MTSFGTFFLPGPTEVRADVLQSMTQPMIAHRGAAFESLFSELQTGLRELFRTTRPVYVSSSSATGLMEGAIRNAPPGPILSLVNGAFAERFADIARSCDREVRVLRVTDGDIVSVAAVAQALAERWYAAVTVVHSETSTGALSDIAAVARAAHAHGAMILVDSVTGVGGAPVLTDAWDLDFIFTGSQKALALPPGLAFAVASERYLLQADSLSNRGRYFDVVEFEKAARKHQTPNTPAVSLLYATQVQLRAMLAEGIDARWARHEAMRVATERWAMERTAEGLLTGIAAAPGVRSPTVTALQLPARLRDSDVVPALARRGFTIGTGYGALVGSTVRVGHMGDHTVRGLAQCLDALTDTLKDALRTVS